MINKILQFVLHCIDKKEEIIDIKERKLHSEMTYCSVVSHYNSTSIVFINFKLNLTLSLQFNNPYPIQFNNPYPIKDAEISDDDLQYFGITDSIIINSVRQPFDTSTEYMFGLSTVLSSVEYQYHSLVKLFRDNNINDSIYVRFVEDGENHETQLDDFYNILDKLIQV